MQKSSYFRLRAWRSAWISSVRVSNSSTAGSRNLVSRLSIVALPSEIARPSLPHAELEQLHVDRLHHHGAGHHHIGGGDAAARRERPEFVARLHPRGVDAHGITQDALQRLVRQLVVTPDRN